MGGGAWTRDSFTSYSLCSGKAVRADGSIDYTGYSTSQVFTRTGMHAELNPKNVVRECRDTEEHPNTIPIIVGIDVTGSMGKAAMTVASMLNSIITGIREKVNDAEFMVMGIGDLVYDNAPIQASQFESDVRIARHLDNLFFEGGGGPNAFESYSAAWYFGAHNTDIDCLKRGKKGIIVTIGDEPLNPTLPIGMLRDALGGIDVRDEDQLRSENVYKDAKEKYDIFHIHVGHDRKSGERAGKSVESFAKVIGEQNVFSTDIDNLPKVITAIVVERDDSASNAAETPVFVLESASGTQDVSPAEHREGEIVW